MSEQGWAAKSLKIYSLIFSLSSASLRKKKYSKCSQMSSKQWVRVENPERFSWPESTNLGLQIIDFEQTKVMGLMSFIAAIPWQSPVLTR